MVSIVTSSTFLIEKMALTHSFVIFQMHVYHHNHHLVAQPD